MVAASVHYGWTLLPPVPGALAAVGYNVLFGIGAVTGVLAARRLRAEGATRDARTWMLFAVASACILAAQAVNILWRGSWVEPFSDVLALCFYPLAVGAFLRDSHRASEPMLRRTTAIDLALVFVAAITVMVALLIRTAGATGWESVPSYLYRAVAPSMAVATVSVVATWLTTEDADPGAALWLAAVAVMWVALGDLLLNVFPADWDRWSNVAWAIGIWVLVIGAQRATASGGPTPRPIRADAGGVVPVIAAGALLLTLLAVLVSQGRPEPVVLALGGATVTVLLLARHWQALRHSAALERARAEQEARLRESERLDALGRMARGVAHDFNGMLTAILGNAEIALDSPPASGAVRESLEQIREAAITAGGITRQLLDFARSGAVEPVEVELGNVVRTQWRLLSGALPGNVVGDLQLDEGPLRVRVGVGFIEQVLHNLVSNARDAMPSGGHLRVELRGRGRLVTLSVSDTGVGMDDATRHRVFEPFFSTKGTRGTGLGLATVYAIVRQSGGEIRLDSAPGRGTTFVLEFPRVD